MDTVHLILFSRAPVAGESKTRLAAAIGAGPARELHACCLNDLIGACEAFAETRSLPGGGRPAVACHLLMTPPGSQAAFTEAGVAIPPRFHVHAQRGDDLGARMAAAFHDVLDGAEPGACALLFGSDLPLLDVRHLEQAVTALRGADVVLGPTEDGGYYLAGMKAPQPRLFDVEGWGGGTVLARTEARARAEGLSTERLPPLPDLDTGEDLARVRAHPLFRELAARSACRFIAALHP